MYTFKITFHIAELNQEMIGSLNFSDYYINESCIYSIKDYSVYLYEIIRLDWNDDSLFSVLKIGESLSVAFGLLAAGK
jgi:hypothetical protein